MPEIVLFHGMVKYLVESISSINLFILILILDFLKQDPFALFFS